MLEIQVMSIHPSTMSAHYRHRHPIDLNLNHYGYGLIAQFPCLTASNFNSQGGQAEGERDLSSREPYRQLLQSTVVVLRAGADQRLPGRRYHAIKHRRDRS